MTRLKYKGKWNWVAGRLQQKFAVLTEEDLILEPGKDDELVGRLEKKLGKSFDDIHKLITNI